MLNRIIPAVLQLSERVAGLSAQLDLNRFDTQRELSTYLSNPSAAGRSAAPDWHSGVEPEVLALMKSDAMKFPANAHCDSTQQKQGRRIRDNVYAKYHKEMRAAGTFGRLSDVHTYTPHTHTHTHTLSLSLSFSLSFFLSFFLSFYFSLALSLSLSCAGGQGRDCPCPCKISVILEPTCILCFVLS
jgi:hypothetical protein